MFGPGGPACLSGTPGKHCPRHRHPASRSGPLVRSWARVLQRTNSCPCAHTQSKQPQNSLCFIRCYSRQMAARTHLWIYPEGSKCIIEERTFVKHFTCSTKVYNCYYYHYWVQVCIAHQRHVVGPRNSYFIWKAGRLEKMVDSQSQRTILPESEFGLLLYQEGGSKVKHFLVLVSLQKGCASFSLPAVIHRWAWPRGFLWAKQSCFSLMFITWETGFPEMGH